MLRLHAWILHVHSWILHVHSLDTACILLGYYLDTTCTLLDITCTLLGYYMYTPWILHVHSLDTTCTLLGYYVYTSKSLQYVFFRKHIIHHTHTVREGIMLFILQVIIQVTLESVHVLQIPPLLSLFPQYLHEALTPFICTLLETEEDCEVDPTKFGPNVSLQHNQIVLRQLVDKAWYGILSSVNRFPRCV